MLEQIHAMYQMTGKPALRQLSDDEWDALAAFVAHEIASENERRALAREINQAALPRETNPEV